MEWDRYAKLPKLANCQKVFLIIDNDAAGKPVVGKIMHHHTEVVSMCHQLYPSFKDFNEYLMAER